MVQQELINRLNLKPGTRHR